MPAAAVLPPPLDRALGVGEDRGREHDAGAGGEALVAVQDLGRRDAQREQVAADNSTASPVASKH